MGWIMVCGAKTHIRHGVVIYGDFLWCRAYPIFVFSNEH
jgi:hypothetical protein